MKLEIELRDGFSPSDFENLKTTLTGFMCAMWKDKGFTTAQQEQLSFNITAWETTHKQENANEQ